MDDVQIGAGPSSWRSTTLNGQDSVVQCIRRAIVGGGPRGEPLFKGIGDELCVLGSKLVLCSHRCLGPIRGAVQRWQVGDLAEKLVAHSRRLIEGENYGTRGFSRCRATGAAVALAAARKLQSHCWLGGGNFGRRSRRP